MGSGVDRHFQHYFSTYLQIDQKTNVNTTSVQQPHRKSIIYKSHSSLFVLVVFTGNMNVYMQQNFQIYGIDDCFQDWTHRATRRISIFSYVPSGSRWSLTWLPIATSGIFDRKSDIYNVSYVYKLYICWIFIILVYPVTDYYIKEFHIRKLKIKQHEPYWKPAVNSGAKTVMIDD
jgi:hypothetical protein